MPDRRWAVIETNVLIAANGKSPQANDACVNKCIQFLRDAPATASIAIDDGGKILAEYAAYCSYSGEPGVGDEFFVWLHENQHTICQRVILTPHQDRVIEQFPDTLALAKFDPSDRKFVATALGCTPTATIYNAVDSDWSHSAPALAAAGVPVTELCPDCLKLKYRPI